MPEYTEEQINKALFVNLVIMFSSAAMQQMGKLAGPGKGKAEIDLEGAQTSIDMLNMLAAKTRGNLLADEEKLLRETLSALQLNFVETAENLGMAAGAGKAAAEPPAAPAAAAEPSAARPGEQKEPKFHKSYGDNS